jgi:hypothetical protein
VRISEANPVDAAALRNLDITTLMGNQVLFDRSALLEAIREQRAVPRAGPYGNDNPLQGTEHADGDFG